MKHKTGIALFIVFNIIAIIVFISEVILPYVLMKTPSFWQDKELIAMLLTNDIIVKVFFLLGIIFIINFHIASEMITIKKPLSTSIIITTVEIIFIVSIFFSFN